MGKPVDYEYLLSGRRGHGRRTEIVRATSADEAVRHFEAEGYSDVVLHTDDTTAPLARPSETRKHVSPRAQVWLRTATPAELGVYLVARFCRILWWLLILAAVVLAFNRVLDLDFGPVDFVAILGLLFPVLFALYFVLVRLFGANQRLQRAVGWARWDEVLRLLDRPAARAHTFDYHLARAQALAGLGHLPDALREYDRVTDLPDVPEFLYWTQLSLVYLAAGNRDKVLDVLHRAHEAAPESSAVMVLYAHNLLVLRRDVRQARQFLADARRHAISDLIAPYVHSLEGMLALEEGRPQEAVDHLTTGVALLEPFVRASPMILVQGARMRARLALALAAAGDTSAARKHFERVRPVLRAHREDELIRQCEQAVG